MLTQDEEIYIFENAYIPEHIVSLMSILSKGEPFLADDYVYYIKDDLAILIGYPLKEEFSLNHFEGFVKSLMKSIPCKYFRMAAPQLPEVFLKRSTNSSSDEYFILPLEKFHIKGSLRREVEKTLSVVEVERGRVIDEGHTMLINEMLERVKPDERIEKLYLSMTDYVRKSDTALVLNAKDSEGRLVAFYILELAAKHFISYLLGCHSKRHYVSHASDVLFFELINVAKEQMKGCINLGLGVNSGIVRFKKKWGGIPYMRYEFCEYAKTRFRFFPFIDLLELKP
ncbi:MAG: hypothetical protein KBH82_02665 [Syntrophorhabdaceae bacterium]|jgi:hypothetical protein|nr:hypothetical protein [Syntrophorhabdaceae bacterium]MDI9562254.1 hypothetical protein [Pseudomonadota bacterium]HQI56059.1 hypothetical protein [Syntrophorhabdaceae bacterium]